LIEVDDAFAEDYLAEEKPQVHTASGYYASQKQASAQPAPTTQTAR
jgi:hypothetical protein